MRVIIAAGVRYWQVQLTVAMGNAADNAELLLQPYELLTLMPLLASLHRKGARRKLQLIPGNNIGFFGPMKPCGSAVTRAASRARMSWAWKRTGL